MARNDLSSIKNYARALSNFEGEYSFEGNIGVPKISLGFKAPDLSGKISKLDKVFKNLLISRLGSALNEAMLSKGWGELGDIYDSGELMNSLQIDITDKGISIRYDVPYASLVYYGGYIVPYGNEAADKVYIPPRPWIEAVLKGGYGIPAINMQEILDEAIASVF